MTASWGGVGVMWGKPSATCYIRQSRYTKTFVDDSEFFTLTVLKDAAATRSTFSARSPAATWIRCTRAA